MHTIVSTTRRRTGVAVAALGLLAGGAVVAAPDAPAGAASSAPGTSAAAAAKSAQRPAVISKKVIGRSVKDRPIRAWELGDRDADVTAVLVGRQHGNEAAGQVILEALRDGKDFEGVHLWVVPVANPDGTKRGIRQNAHGLDLNRNWPHRWKAISGYYDSGPRPASEPETKALKKFFKRVDPDYAVSIHTPLYGLDVKRAKDPPFARKLRDELKLPHRKLTCSGGCHGTTSQWFNKELDGALVTIEYGHDPSLGRLTKQAPKGFLRVFGAHYVD